MKVMTFDDYERLMEIQDRVKCFDQLADPCVNDTLGSSYRVDFSIAKVRKSKRGDRWLDESESLTQGIAVLKVTLIFMEVRGQTVPILVPVPTASVSTNVVSGLKAVWRSASADLLVTHFFPMLLKCTDDSLLVLDSPRSPTTCRIASSVREAHGVWNTARTDVDERERRDLRQSWRTDCHQTHPDYVCCDELVMIRSLSSTLSLDADRFNWAASRSSEQIVFPWLWTSRYQWSVCVLRATWPRLELTTACLDLSYGCKLSHSWITRSVW